MTAKSNVRVCKCGVVVIGVLEDLDPSSEFETRWKREHSGENHGPVDFDTALAAARARATERRRRTAAQRGDPCASAK